MILLSVSPGVHQKKISARDCVSVGDAEYELLDTFLF